MLPATQAKQLIRRGLAVRIKLPARIIVARSMREVGLTQNEGRLQLSSLRRGAGRLANPNFELWLTRLGAECQQKKTLVWRQWSALSTLIPLRDRGNFLHKAPTLFRDTRRMADLELCSDPTGSGP